MAISIAAAELPRGAVAVGARENDARVETGHVDRTAGQQHQGRRDQPSACAPSHHVSAAAVPVPRATAPVAPATHSQTGMEGASLSAFCWSVTQLV